MNITTGCETFQDCFTIFDCTTRAITVGGNVTNTCPDVSFGEIDLALSWNFSGSLNLAWSNGVTSTSSNSLKLDNLSQGTYCVTVSDPSGCDISVTECFTVGLNQHEFGWNTTRPCGTQFTCNGKPSIFQDSQLPETCRYENCTEWTCRCPLTGGVISAVDNGYTSFRINGFSCTYEGRCREFPFNWEVINEGSIVAEAIWISLPNCNCGYCREDVYCVVSTNSGTRRVYLGSREARPEVCGIDTGEVNPDCIITFKEFEYSLRFNNLIDSDTELWLPQEFSAEVDMDYYNNYMDSVILKDEYILIRQFTEDERISELDCGLNNGENLQSDVTSRESINGLNSSQNFNEYEISCSPNPFREEVVVSIEKADFVNTLFTYQFINILGQVVDSGFITQRDNILNTRNIDSGTYILVILDEEKNQKHIEKLVKN